MTLPRDYTVLTDYSLSDEAAAYIADALMELALEFEATHLARSAVTASPSSPRLTICNSICFANQRHCERGGLREGPVTTYNIRSGEAEAGSAGEQPAEE